MKPTPLASLAAAAFLAACGRPSEFEGEWDVVGSDWFNTQGFARAEARTLERPAARPGDDRLGATGASPIIGERPQVETEVPDTELETAWVVPSFGRRTIVSGNDSDLVIRLSGCDVPADVVSPGLAEIPLGFACSQRIGAGTVDRTFTSGRLVVEKKGVVLTAGGTFSHVLNGHLMTGTFHLNETLTRRR